MHTCVRSRSSRVRAIFSEMTAIPCSSSAENAPLVYLAVLLLSAPSSCISVSLCARIAACMAYFSLRCYSETVPRRKHVVRLLANGTGVASASGIFFVYSSRHARLWAAFRTRVGTWSSRRKRCKSRYPPTTTAASICHARRSSPWLLRSPHAPLRPALGRVGSHATLLLHPHAPMLRVPVHPTSLPGPRQLLRALSPLCVSKRGPEFTPVSDSLLSWGRGLLATKSKAQATAVHSLTAVLSSSARSSGGSSTAASVIKPTQERPTRRNLKHVDRTGASRVLKRASLLP